MNELIKIYKEFPNENWDHHSLNKNPNFNNKVKSMQEYFIIDYSECQDHNMYKRINIYIDARNPYLDIEETLKCIKNTTNITHKQFLYNSISLNPNITLELIKKYPDIWSFEFISRNLFLYYGRNIPATKKYIQEMFELLCVINKKIPYELCYLIIEYLI